MKKLFFIVILVTFVSFGCGKKEEAEKTTTISVAASLADGVKEIADKYYKETGNKVVLNLGGSGTLRRAVENGAPVDGVIFASDLDVQKLVDKKLVEKKIKILRNKLVVLSKYKISSLEDIKGFTALGDPSFVPAGKYAKESLDSLKLWDKVSKNIILTKDVRSALTYARSGEVDYAFVYKTDAVLARDLVFYKVPQSLYSEIIYSMGAVDNSKSGEKFLTYLQNHLNTFTKYGFEEYK